MVVRKKMSLPLVLRQNSALRILVIVFFATCLLFILWLAGGRKMVENIVDELTQPWAVFQVPGNAIPIEGMHASLESGVITICNVSRDDWNHVLIRIDQGYLAALDHLKNGECKRIPVSNFATESWKRMPPPRDLIVSRVAVMATVPRVGYAENQLSK